MDKLQLYVRLSIRPRILIIHNTHSDLGHFHILALPLLSSNSS